MPPAPNPSRILIVRLSHLGDVVHALPVYHALRERFPSGRIAWAVQPEFAELVEGLPGVSQVLRFDRRGGVGAWPRLRRELRAFRADWAIDAQGNWKSAAVTFLSGARRRSGFHPGEWREPLAWLCVNDRVPPTPRVDGPVHALDRGLHLARTLAGVEESWFPRDWLELSVEERRRGEDRWRELLGDRGERVVLLQLARGGDPRAWPTEHQRALLLLLAERGLTPLALSGPGEAELGARLAEELRGEPRIRHWVGQRGLRELAAFLTVAAERGARFCAGDSGPLHLAVASGLPVVSLAGPQDPRRTGPWPPEGRGGPHRVLRAMARPECMPCNARRCAHPEGAVCLSRLTPEVVVKELLTCCEGRSAPSPAPTPAPSRASPPAP